MCACNLRLGRHKTGQILERMTEMTAASAPRHRLDGLIAPRSIVLVGASEKNHFSNLAMNAIRRIGFDGQLYLVNRKGAEAYGLPATTTCAAIGQPVDTAYLCVPGEAVLDAAEEAIGAGIRNLVVVASGFAEVGDEGKDLEARFLALCAANDVRVLGPNCLGYRNNVAKVALGSMPFADQKVAGNIGLISVSGSVAVNIAHYAAQQGAGLTHVIATGNEMNVTTSDLVDYLVDIPEVRAIALFMEGIKDPETFVSAAARAHAAKKPIVAIKAGAAETTAAIAAAHTGSAVGDDKVFNAVCERLGIVRVATIEHLVTTAAALAEAGPITRPGTAFVSISGGICEIASDAGDLNGVSFPQFSADTKAKLAPVISDFGQMHNPLDLTGAAVKDVAMWKQVTDVVSADENVGLVMLNWDVPNLADPSMATTVAAVGEILAERKMPALLVSNFPRPINEHGLAYMARYGISFTLPGLTEGLAAVGRLGWWSERIARPLVRPALKAAATSSSRPADERQALAHLAAHGVPVIPQLVATSGAEAAAHARTIGSSVALKILSPDIAHKTEVGGVVLGQQGDADVTAAYDRIMASVTAHKPNARIEGVLISPMRSGGLEFFAGVAVDPVWGPVMALGLGGVWMEALADTVLCMLPAGPEEILRACRSLRGAKLLDGYRGSPAADMEALAKAIAGIGEAALALGPDLAAFEVNPLLIDGSRIEALDALAVWKA